MREKQIVKFNTLIFASLFAIGLLTGCQKTCDHQWNATVKKAAYGFQEGIMTRTCEKCGESYDESIPASGTVKILMIGNSFSEDSACFLWDICTEVGLKDVVIGEVWMPGSGIDDHYRCIQSNAAEYEYKKNTTGVFATTPGVTLLSAVQDEQWDAIVVTPLSSAAGQSNALSHIADVMGWLDENRTNPNADLFWNMTWAYPQTSDESRFFYFNNDQMTMYEAITAYVKNDIASLDTVAGIIPTGTTIQNLRTSYLGDTLCRDSIHLSYTHGRYAAALTVCAYLTGCDIGAVEHLPTMLEALIADDLPVIKQSVADALQTPYAPTKQVDTRA